MLVRTCQIQRSLQPLTAPMLGLFIAMSTMAGDLETVNEPGGSGFNQWAPTLIQTSEGALCLFRDMRTGSSHFRTQALDSNGQPVGESHELELDELPSLSATALTFGSNRSGDVYACWAHVGVDGRTIARIDPKTGILLEERQILQDEGDLGPSAQLTFEVFEDGTTVFFFMADGLFKGRLLTADFQPVGPAFLIEDNTGGNYVDTALHDDGSFTLAWTGVAAPYFSIVRARRFGPDGQPDGPEFDLTDEADAVFIETPSIAARSDGSAMVAWMRLNPELTIVGHLLGPDGQPVGDAVDLLSGDEVIGNPVSLDARPDDSWALVQHADWGTGDISVQQLSNDMSSVETLEITEVPDGDSLWLDVDERLLVVWSDRIDHPHKDLMGRTIFLDDGTSSEASSITEDPDGANQFHPVVAGNRTGRSAVAWVDHRNDAGELYVQVHDASGDPDGPNRPAGSVLMDDDPMIDIAMDTKGAFVVSWLMPGDSGDMYVYRRFNADGTPSGGIRHVVEQPEYSTGIELLDDGRLLVTWGRFVEFESGGLARINVMHRLFGSDDVPVSTQDEVANIEGMGRSCRLIGPGTTAAGEPIIWYQVVRRYTGHASGLHSTITSRQIDEAGVAFGSEDVHHARPGYFSALSIGSDDGGVLIASRHPDDPGTITVRQLSIDHDLEHETSFTHVNELTDPVVVCGGSDLRMVCFRETLEAGDLPGIEDSVRLLGAQAIDPAGRLNGDVLTLTTVDLDQTIQQVTNDRHCGLAANRLLNVLSAATGTDQGYDIMLLQTPFDSCMPADYDCDGSIDGDDLSKLLGSWGTNDADLDGDGTTDGADLTILLGLWTP